MGAVEGGQVQLITAHLPGKEAMIAGVSQESAADGIVRLRKLSDGNFRLAAVVGEIDRPAARYIGVVGRGCLKKAELLASLRMQRDVLLLAAQLDQADFALQFIALRIGDEAV